MTELIQHEEGRIVLDATIGNFEYEYYLKDHLGNTRVVFTTKPKEINFKLNYEGDPNNPDDQPLFEDVQIGSEGDFNHTTGDSNYTNAQVFRSSPHNQVGSAIAIPVGQGDKITAVAFVKYIAVAQDPNVSSVTIASALVSAFTGVASSGIEGGTGTINNNFGSGSLIGGTGFPLESATAPRAFLNLMFLPEDTPIDLVKDTSFAYDQVADGATESVIDGVSNSPFDELRIDDFVAPAQGYVMVYVSNEGSLTDVYFDDIEITVNEHPVVQRTDYYPFGSIAQQYNRITTPKNRFLYNGKEEVEEWGMQDYGRRWRDAWVVPFTTIDRFAEKYYSLSPNSYGANNPIKYIDVNGDSLWIKVNKKNSALYVDGKLYNKNGTQYNGAGTKVDKKGNRKLTGFLKNTVSALDQIGQGKEGGKLLGELQSSSQNVTIKAGTTGNQYDTKTNELEFNTTSTTGGLNTRGSTTRPTYIGLGHELFHSLDDVRGTVSGKKAGTTNQTEIFASHGENLLRAENALPLRAQYNSGTPIIDAFGNSIYYGNNYYNDLKMKPKPGIRLVSAFTPPKVNIRKR